ncbi:hypothetical protein BDN70DRAFT_888814 [Pholiota conissans]|uniref:Uncharacterized protein n=1 Tax=Pholiota conissans TaxID=109636 RepID=A0A9P5YKS0_9AGAR|nr:hypothetical protein BDN70DRAFT_888814 [Pholiota conissans]
MYLDDERETLELSPTCRTVEGNTNSPRTSNIQRSLKVNYSQGPEFGKCGIAVANACLERSICTMELERPSQGAKGKVVACAVHGVVNRSH